MNRRSLTAALASVALGLTVALMPAASASAAGNGSLTIYNTCGQNATVWIYYSGGSQYGGASIVAGGHVTFSLAPGKYGVTTSPKMTYWTVRSGQGWAVRLCY